MFIKLCGLRKSEDVRVARELAVDAIGINLVTTSRRMVDSDTALVLSLAAHDLHVFLVIDADPPAALAHLLASVPRASVQRTDNRWPWPDFVAPAQRVEVVRLRSPADVEAAAALASGLLLSDAARGLGGTGERGDWPLTRMLATRRDTVLAGGLTPENVAEAIRTVRPFGVDVASGIEENGQISQARMRAFAAAARGAQ